MLAGLLSVLYVKASQGGILGDGLVDDIAQVLELLHPVRVPPAVVRGGGCFGCVRLLIFC